MGSINIRGFIPGSNKKYFANLRKKALLLCILFLKNTYIDGFDRYFVDRAEHRSFNFWNHRVCEMQFCTFFNRGVYFFYNFALTKSQKY